MEREGVPNVEISAILRDGIVRKHIKVVYVLSRRVWLIVDGRAVTGVEHEVFVLAVGHGLGHHSLVWDHEALGEGTAQVVVLQVVDRVPEGYRDLHQVRSVIQGGEVYALPV